jgi:hypothetical protein
MVELPKNKPTASRQENLRKRLIGVTNPAATPIL